MKIDYITSDLHVYHDNIIVHCKRPCYPGDAHTQWIMSIVNEPVKDCDNVWHLGDFVGGRVKLDALKKIINMLNGTWYFIIGNHDNADRLREACKGTRHKVIGDYKKIVHKGVKFILFHYPISSWDCKHHNSIHLHGHIHNSRPDNMPNRFNVGLDTEHRLFTLDEFIERRVDVKN